MESSRETCFSPLFLAFLAFLAAAPMAISILGAASTGCFYDFSLESRKRHAGLEPTEPTESPFDSGMKQAPDASVVTPATAGDADSVNDSTWQEGGNGNPAKPADAAVDVDPVACNAGNTCGNGAVCVALFRGGNRENTCIPADPCEPMACSCIHYPCFPGICQPLTQNTFRIDCAD